LRLTRAARPKKTRARGDARFDAADVGAVVAPVALEEEVLDAEEELLVLVDSVV